MSGLHVSGVSKRFGRVDALQGVTFEVRPGEILGLIGPNGAGKTTLLECVAGLMPAETGVVLLGDRALGVARRREQLFYLPDAIAPWPTQTVDWALGYAVGFLGGRAELRGELVATLALEPLLRAPIGSLSKGERKRALLAIGLLAPQPMLLIDEPFDGLDLRQSREAAALLRSHAKRDRTLVLSIHQIADAARLCDRFVMLSSGRVRGFGTLAELLALAGDSPNLEEAFLALT
jgi:ABC-2 type transport system ATP-binding protein